MIPKIIHYCWLSGEKFKPIQEHCIATWKSQLADYQFIKWNKKRSNKIQSKFYRKMLRAENWVYASDYVRLFALYLHGGFYLDLDVEILKSLDPLLNKQIVLGLEDESEKSLGCHFIGAEPHHPFIAACMSFYDKSLKLKFSFPPTMPRIITKIAQQNYAYKNFARVN